MGIWEPGKSDRQTDGNFLGTQTTLLRSSVPRTHVRFLLAYLQVSERPWKHRVPGERARLYVALHTHVHVDTQKDSLQHAE